MSDLRPEPRSYAPERDPAPIAFIHIPRTGGNSIGAAIRQTYGASAFRLKTNHAPTGELLVGMPPDVRVIYGHMPWGLHRFTPVRYATVLRDPIGRSLSHFALWRYQRVRKSGRTEPPGFEEFLEKPFAADLQTRLLAGASPMDEMPSDALELARANLSDFAIVGFFEDLPAFARRMGLAGPLAHINGGARPPPTPAQVEALRQANPQDLELYAWARARFGEAQVFEDFAAVRRPIGQLLGGDEHGHGGPRSH